MFGGVVHLAEVRVQEGEPLENALRRFKRKVQQEDIIKEVKRHSFYLKPGERRRVKEALARKRNRKRAEKERDKPERCLPLLHMMTAGHRSEYQQLLSLFRNFSFPLPTTSL